MTAGTRAAAWAGLGAGVAALGAAGVLLHRTLTVALEIRRYADEIAEAGDAVRRNTAVADDLARLRSLTGEARAAVAGTGTVDGGATGAAGDGPIPTGQQDR